MATVKDTNCKMFILAAVDKVNGSILYYQKGDTFIETTASIWYAKFYSGKKGVMKAYDNVTKRASYNYRTGHDLEWKIQEVSMNAPVTVEF